MARKNRRKAQAYLKQMNSAYLKATRQIELMEKQGYAFSKQFKKSMSLESFSKKAQKPTKAKVKALKAVTTKTALYKKATGFYESGSDHKVSVKEGKRIVRARNKAQKQALVTNNLGLASDLIDGIPDFFSLPWKNGKYGGLSVTTDKKQALEKIDEMKQSGEQINDKQLEQISSRISELEYARYSDDVIDLFAGIMGILNNGTATGLSGGGIETIGTPWEEEQ